MIAEVDGISLYYEQRGQGPDLLLLPGLGASVHVWYPQLRDLSAVMRVTAADPRGHGRSGKPPGPYSVREMAQDVAGLIRGTQIGPAVVAASSMSSLVAVHLAAHSPDLVRALVLVGGFAALPPEGKARFEARARTAETEGMEPLADLVVAAAMGAHTHATQPGLAGLFRQALMTNDTRAYAAACRAIAEADVTPLLPEVRCPTLILLGAQEQVAPLPAARRLKAGIPHAEIHVIPDAGHLPFMEQPGAFNAAVYRFVTGLGEA